jgi:alkanesulfonate monooxygenase SsuD/methylene tetrahydromethanopterin reductase-like flavin-dependent oxidoreductase (luciferase family)
MGANAMSVQLGMFFMPFHHPERDYATILEEDREAIILADRLGFSEVFVGEHYSSLAERIPSPLIFMATLIAQTRRIRFATGVFNMTAQHPAVIAGQAAEFDHLSRGRFIMGIGPGGLVSDLEMFDVGPPEQRPRMAVEAMETILKLWSQDPPYSINGQFWKFAIRNGIWPEFGVGTIPRPFQMPHPPIALSLITPNSSSAVTAGERGWIPVSGNFFHRRFLRGHWERYAEGCEKAGRRPDPSMWRVARCVLVTPSDGEADDYLAGTGTGMDYYYRFFRHSFDQGRKALFMLKPDDALPDQALTVDGIKRELVIAGSPRRVLDQLVALRDEIGPFGTLLMTGHDWDRAAMWKRSMELLAGEVMPAFGRHAAAA